VHVLLRRTTSDEFSDSSIFHKLGDFSLANITPSFEAGARKIEIQRGSVVRTHHIESPVSVVARIIVVALHGELTYSAKVLDADKEIFLLLVDAETGVAHWEPLWTGSMDLVPKLVQGLTTGAKEAKQKALESYQKENTSIVLEPFAGAVLDDLRLARNPPVASIVAHLTWDGSSHWQVQFKNYGLACFEWLSEAELQCYVGKYNKTELDLQDFESLRTRWTESPSYAHLQPGYNEALKEEEKAAKEQAKTQRKADAEAKVAAKKAAADKVVEEAAAERKAAEDQAAATKLAAEK
jgi:hypothetical protein